VAPSSSSTKKAAKLAKSGQGKKVRFQGGTMFPMVLAIVIVLGFALVVYARQSRPSADASAPLQTDHWHHAYGFYLCDTWFKLSGNAEEQDSNGLINTEFARTGIHSHDDGLIHWHPYSVASVGSNAKLGVFLDVYGVELTNSKLTFPESQRANLPYQQETGVFENGETTCTIDGKEVDGELKVVVWDNFSDTDNGTTYIADFDNIRLDQDQMVVSIAFVPKNTDVTMPPWASDLPALGDVDSGQLSPEDQSPGSSVPGASIAPSAVTDSTTPTGSTPATTGG
jgi:hypothetical protein